MKVDADTVSAMALAGIEFIAPVQRPGGGTRLNLDPKDIPAYMSDPANFIANSMGVTKTEYETWVETEGTPRCGATTSSGKRCKNVVSGGIQMPIDEWLRLDGGYCAVHGGDGSEEAKLQRRNSRGR